MTDDHMNLLVAPEVSFDALRSKLTARGYSLSDQSADPLIAGEPEWAVFEDGSGSRIHYSFNPVASLRSLEFHGSEAGPALLVLADSMPTVDWVRARSFLSSSNPRDQWLGVLAAERLGDSRLRPMVEALVSNGQPRIAAAAQQALDSLPQPSVEAAEAWEKLIAEQRKQPGLNMLFRRLPDVELKRQVLRWTGSEGVHGGAGVERLLRTALADDDPEVRVTAMLVAARLGQHAVTDVVTNAHVPEDRAEGAPPGDRLYYRKLQRLAVRHLAMPHAATLDGKSIRQRENFEKAVRGEEPVRSDETMLWHALVTPLELGEPPDRLPAGVVKTPGGYALSFAGSKIELCWVGRVPHWLGGLNAGRTAGQVRQVTPPAPYFMSVHPLTVDIGEQERPWVGTFHSTVELLGQIGQATGLPVRMPTAEEWEMAARGPDGRFYPWGIGLQPAWEASCSPWGMSGWGMGEEWAVLGQPLDPVVVGGHGPMPAARRVGPGLVTSAGARLVLPC